MSFVSPAWLLLLLLGPLIVLFHSRPRRNVEVSSLLLWRHTVRAVPPRASWKPPVPNLLMLLQLLVLVLIAVALARPVPFGRAGAIDHWIVLFDASGSMQARVGGSTPFAEAAAHLAGELRRVDGSPRRISLVSAAGGPSIVGARLSRPEQVREALEALRPSHTRAEWGEVAALLPGLLLEGERTRVTILSDPRGSVEARAGIVEAVPGAAVDAIAFGGPIANRALARVVPLLLDAERGRWRITGEVHTFAAGDEGWQGRPVAVRVLFEPAGATGALEWTAIDVGTGGESVAAFEVEVTLPGSGLLEVRLAEDGLTHDNSAHFVLHGKPREARVLYVGRGNPPLERALEAIPGVHVTRETSLPESAAAFDLVVVDGVAASRPPGSSTVWLGVAPDGRGTDRLEDPSPSGWLDAHPLARSVDWSALSVRAARHVPLLPGAEVVLESSGLALIQARTTAEGREVVIGFDFEDTNWPELLGFPAFVANLVRWAVPDAGSAVAPTCQVGLPCPLEPRELTGEWRLVESDGSELPLPSFFVTSEDAGQGEAWLPRAVEAVFTPRLSGVHTIESTGLRRTIAVNTPFSAAADLSVESNADPAASHTDRSVAWLPLRGWLLLLALAALCAEGWIAGRKSERFLRVEGLARGNPLAPRRRLILALRVSAIALLVLAVTNPRGVIPLIGAEAVLVIDDAGSQRESVRTAAGSFLSAAGDEANRSRRLGLVRIGPEGRVAGDIGAADFAARDTAASGLPGADPAAALRLAGALLPREGTGRIVVVSDGSETRGSVAGAIPDLLARGVPVDVHLLSGFDAGDVVVEQVVFPPAVHPNEVATLQGVVASHRATTGTARLWREGTLESERIVDLLPGRNRIEFEIVEDTAGTYLYEVEVDAEDDEYGENDRNGVLVEVRPMPRVAIVTPQPSWGRSLADALFGQGIDAEVMTPDRAPRAPASPGPDARQWSDFDLISLMNVPASDLAISDLEGLEAWVRDSGGGLLLLGGENTFGPGGYFDTALETLSPLSARVPQELPNLAIVFVLDRSGSMAQFAGAGSRLDIAKVATMEALELLDPESLVGVVAFDNNAQLVVPIQPAEDLGAVRAQLERMEPGGGTWIYPGLAMAYVQLSQIDEDFRRHIVVMSDGRSREGDFRSLLGLIAEAGMTVSTAAIGQGADVRLLEEIARGGGGTAHVTTDFSELPSILAREASRFSSSPVREEPLTPIWRSRDAPFLRSLPDVPPALYGFVRTTAKPAARVYLEGADDVPLLASWRYGLGRVVAFASHGAGPWAADWMAASDYAVWWSQIVRWTLPGAAGPGLHLHLARERDYGRVAVEAVRPDGGVGDGLELVATIVAPGGGQPVSTGLTETAPGIYEGSFIADRSGTYAVTVRPDRESRAGPAEAVEGRLHVGYPARYEFRASDTDLLRALAQVSGGRVLAGDERIFDQRVPVTWVRRSLWPFWALLALGLFMVELSGRYASSLPRPRGYR